MKVAPVAIIKIPGNDDKGDLLVNRMTDKTVKCFASCRPDSLGSRPLVSREPYERAVDMNVRGMDKAERCHLSPLFISVLEHYDVDRYSATNGPASRFCGRPCQDMAEMCSPDSPSLKEGRTMILQGRPTTVGLWL